MISCNLWKIRKLYTTKYTFIHTQLSRHKNILNEIKISENSERSIEKTFVIDNKHSNHFERPFVHNFYCALNTTCYQSTLFEDSAYHLGKKCDNYLELLVYFLLTVYYYCRNIVDIFDIVKVWSTRHVDNYVRLVNAHPCWIELNWIHELILSQTSIFFNLMKLIWTPLSFSSESYGIFNRAMRIEWITFQVWNHEIDFVSWKVWFSSF